MARCVGGAHSCSYKSSRPEFLQCALLGGILLSGGGWCKSLFGWRMYEECGVEVLNWSVGRKDLVFLLKCMFQSFLLFWNNANVWIESKPVSFQLFCFNALHFYFTANAWSYHTEPTDTRLQISNSNWICVIVWPWTQWSALAVLKCFRLLREAAKGRKCDYW